MPDDERFSEAEIRAVFERAAADYARAAQQTSPDGLTLDEMADVGEASGIPRAYVEAAAQAVRLGEPESRRETQLGIATGVGHTAFLAEPPSDALWERLVADARRTFDARGRTETAGRTREWRNGNLVLSLEPAGDGSRLDVRSRRTDAAPFVRLGAALALIGAFVLATGLLSGEAGAWVPGLLVLLMGAIAAAGITLRQRSWADTRDVQMRALVERAEVLDPARGALGEARPVAEAPERAAPRTTSTRPGLDFDAFADDSEPTNDSEAPWRRTRS